MRKVSVWLFCSAILLLIVAGYLFLRTSGEWLAFDATGSVWVVLTALGTVGASVIALVLAAKAFEQERTVVAGLVSAWVEDRYEPRSDVPAYRRIAIVHIANESNEPVFDAHLSVIVGQNPVRLGPLSAPSSIAVVPQRRTLSFDISVPLRAHENTWNPRAELTFSDARGRRWFRDLDGSLMDTTGAKAKWVEEDIDVRQLGGQSLDNPMTIALAFLAGLSADVFSYEALEVTLAPEAKWKETDWEALREAYGHFTPTSLVDYPAPYISRVKLVGDTNLQGKTLAGERMQLVGARFLTLTYVPARGWRVWGIGDSVTPDMILFPLGTFDTEH
jgi:hypothetical protein